MTLEALKAKIADLEFENRELKQQLEYRESENRRLQDEVWDSEITYDEYCSNFSSQLGESKDELEYAMRKMASLTKEIKKVIGEFDSLDDSWAVFRIRRGLEDVEDDLSKAFYELDHM